MTDTQVIIEITGIQGEPGYIVRLWGALGLFRTASSLTTPSAERRQTATQPFRVGAERVFAFSGYAISHTRSSLTTTEIALQKPTGGLFGLGFYDVAARSVEWGSMGNRRLRECQTQVGTSDLGQIGIGKVFHRWILWLVSDPISKPCFQLALGTLFPNPDLDVCSSGPRADWKEQRHRVVRKMSRSRRIQAHQEHVIGIIDQDRIQPDGQWNERGVGGITELCLSAHYRRASMPAKKAHLRNRSDNFLKRVKSVLACHRGQGELPDEDDLSHFTSASTLSLVSGNSETGDAEAAAAIYYAFTGPGRLREAPTIVRAAEAMKYLTAALQGSRGTSL
ncbi:hypothetical protein B0H11DRAFT_1906201 [Mycena galericulata]|nr:hypothetical protein B0H11DRAFT_1906201 [Mycena galericulata]